MKRYIDADELYTEGYCLVRDIHINGALLRDSRSLLDVPTEDVQAVVRCKDCRHRYLDKKYGFRCVLDTGDPFEEGRSAENDDWFCADGVKMDGEQMRRR